MKKVYERWWAGGNKVFQINNYRESWIKEGNKPRLLLHSNGARRKNGDSCYDISLIVGYTIFNYTNFDLQGRCSNKKND
jgi:hypothetical protein